MMVQVRHSAVLENPTDFEHDIYAITLTEVPIVDLTASSDSPTTVGQATHCRRAPRVEGRYLSVSGPRPVLL